jgi:hypothetical protein
MGHESPAIAERPDSVNGLPQLYELVGGDFKYRGHIIDYADPKTWPRFMPIKPWSHPLDEDDILIWTVRCYFPNAVLTFDDRGAVVSDDTWSFVACSREAMGACGSYARVFFVQNLIRAASLKIGARAIMKG